MQLSNLDKRHPGVSQGIAMAYREAAEVCLGRHGRPPSVFSLIHDDGSAVVVDVDWSVPSSSLMSAWANVIDATEFGAYCVALAAVEITCDLYAVYRAETQSGADYYLAPKDFNATDLEDLVRLEVSGIDKSTPQIIASRLRQKLQQIRRGASNTPGIASIVVFDQLVVISAHIA